VPEFVAWTLCGEQVSEPSLASRTGLVDQATGAPWHEALTVLGVPDGSHTARRYLNSTARWSPLPATTTRSPPSVPVRSGPENLFDSCGTAEVLLRVVPRALEDAQRSTLVGLGIDAGRHVVPGHSVLLDGMRSGLVMRRMLSLLGADDPARRDELDRHWVPNAVRRRQPLDPRRGDRRQRRTGPPAGRRHPRHCLGGDPHAPGRADHGAAGRHHVRGGRARRGGRGRLDPDAQRPRVQAPPIPRLTFCRVEQPGARGAALFAACAALGEDSIDERARRFAATAELPIPTAGSAAEPALRPNYAVPVECL
jgi:hypothetical protein